MSSKPKIKLYFLQASRSIRVAWLLSELDLPYENVFFPRVENKAPEDFKERSGSKLGKSPVLWDGDVMVVESGCITEYILETYAPTHIMAGSNDPQKRAKVRAFIHAAEGTFMIHALAITYARWFSPENVKESGDLDRLEEGLAINVWRDLDWLEGELGHGKGYIVGEDLTAADTMCLFGIQFIFKRDLCKGRKIEEWPAIKKWVERCEARDGWKTAIEKTGHAL